MIDLARIVGFDWDDGNARKSEAKHAVSQAEAERAFFAEPLIILADPVHSREEERFHALGRTLEGRRLFVSFTVRRSGALIRVISARDMSRKAVRSGIVMTKKLKPIPEFRNEAEERKFWETHDSSDYLEWGGAQRVRFPNLKPSTTSISLRLPVSLLEQIKVAANRRDMPYQSLIKVWLTEKAEQK